MGGSAPDGSPVEVYRRLSAHGEPELVHTALPAGAEILELGCGTGRLTQALLALGHPVTAVDQSPEMLAEVTGATRVLANIETLRLERRFACVLLASHLVNTSDERQRGAFVRTCAAHVEPDGAVVIQRLAADWARAVGQTVERDGLAITLREAYADADGSDVGLVEYTAGSRAWRHAFRVRTLDDAAFAGVLRAGGLRLERWLDERRTWALARSGADAAETPDARRRDASSEAHGPTRPGGPTDLPSGYG